MFKLKKSILIVGMILLVLVSISAVSATDTIIVDTDTVLENNTNEINLVEDSNTLGSSSENIANTTNNNVSVANYECNDDVLPADTVINNNLYVSIGENSNVNENNKVLGVNDDDSFTALNKTITNNTNGTIILGHDYIMYSDEVEEYATGIVINKNITINGNGYCINANKTGRIFTLGTGVVLTLRNITLTNGQSSYGGAIYLSSNVNLICENVSFVNNSANLGGAISANNGNVNINANVVRFVNNTATWSGGAIYAYNGNVNINGTDVSFVNNRGSSVIYADNDGNIVNSTFIGNHIIIGINTVYQDCVLTVFINNQQTTSVKPNENFNLTAKLVDNQGNTYYSTGLTYQIYNQNTLIMNVTDVDDLFNTIVNLTNNGVYNITAKYNDPDKKITDYTIKNATVYVNSIVLMGEDLIKYYKGTEKYNIYLKLNDNPLAGETVAITINGKTYNFITDNNGLISLPIDLSAGNYTVSSVYNGSYGVASLENNITIKPTIVGSDTTVYYRNGSSYIVHVVDSQGRTAVGQKVRMNINGVFYNRVTDSNGDANLPIGLAPGNYTITAENRYNGEKTSNNIEVLPTLVEGQDVTIYHRNGSGYSIKVLDGQGNPISNVKVRMNVNGVFYTVTSDENGVATLLIGLSPGDYIITAEYNGFKTSNKITVLPVLVGSDVTLHYRDGTNYTVQVLDGQGQPLVGVNVTMNINGVFYNVTSDDKGIASLQIGLRPGKYIVTTIYKDHRTSNKVTVLH